MGAGWILIGFHQPVFGANAMGGTDVLRDRSPRQVMEQTPGRLVIIGRRITDELELPINVVPDHERCVVVVQRGSGDQADAG
jgi:hypothetical protein